VYSIGFGIPNKRGESTHGKSKPKTLDCGQMYFFQYSQGTLQFKLAFKRLPPQDLVGYCDADWANDLKDKRSTIGFVFMMGGGATSWNSK
jgi:hypothetical protein